MAKQTINIGTFANDNTGDTIRDAFDKVNDNFTELYTDDAGDVNSITATAPIARDQATGAVTISLNDAGVTLAKIQNVAANSLLVRDANSSGVLTEKALADTQILIGDGTGMTAAALSGDVTMANTGAVTIANTAVETAMVANNAITHDKLENRYTSVVTKTDTSGTGGSAIDIGWDDGAVFNFSNSLTGDIELKFDAYKAGQVIDIYGLTGSHTVTLNSTASGTEVFNKVGGVYYDGGSSNLIQVVCVNDSASTPVFNYAIATYTSAQP